MQVEEVRHGYHHAPIGLDWTLKATFDDCLPQEVELPTNNIWFHVEPVNAGPFLFSLIPLEDGKARMSMYEVKVMNGPADDTTTALEALD